MSRQHVELLSEGRQSKPGFSAMKPSGLVKAGGLSEADLPQH